MRKERGYVGILHHLLPLYTSGGSNLGHLVCAGVERTDKGWVSSEVAWASGRPGWRAAWASRAGTAGSLGSAPRTGGAKRGVVPTFFPPQDDGRFNFFLKKKESMTGGGPKQEIKKINKS